MAVNKNFYDLYWILLIAFFIDAITQHCKGQVSNQVCGSTVSYNISETPCVSCFKNRRVRCLGDSRKITRSSGRRGCRYDVKVGRSTRKATGCSHLCRETITTLTCCDGFWGSDCHSTNSVSSTATTRVSMTNADTTISVILPTKNLLSAAATLSTRASPTTSSTKAWTVASKTSTIKATPSADITTTSTSTTTAHVIIPTMPITTASTKAIPIHPMTSKETTIASSTKVNPNSSMLMTFDSATTAALIAQGGPSNFTTAKSVIVYTATSDDTTSSNGVADSASIQAVMYALIGGCIGMLLLFLIVFVVRKKKKWRNSNTQSNHDNVTQMKENPERATYENVSIHSSQAVYSEIPEPLQHESSLVQKSVDDAPKSVDDNDETKCVEKPKSQTFIPNFNVYESPIANAHTEHSAM